MNAGSRISLSLVNDKANRRNKIVGHVFDAVQTAVTNRLTDIKQPADEINYFKTDKNAFIFDMNLISRYFNNESFKNATHLMVIAGAHTITQDGFTENEPTVILAPVQKETETDYRIVGNQNDDAASEWPTGFAQTRFNSADTKMQSNLEMFADDQGAPVTDTVFVFTQSPLADD